MRRFFSTLWNRFNELPAHDPMDWREGPGAGRWFTGRYCRNCKVWTKHEDVMSGICGSCGSKKGVRDYRSTRYIWDGRNWCIQHKYDDGPNDYEIE